MKPIQILKTLIVGLSLGLALASCTKTELSAEKIAEQNPYLDRGLEYYNRGDHAQAIAVWRQISEGHPLYARAQNNIGASAILLKRFDEAEKAINNALRVDPKSQLFLNNQKWLNQEKEAAKAGQK